MPNKNPQPAEKKFFFRESPHNPELIELTDEGTGLVVCFKKIDGKALNKMNQGELQWVAKQFDELVVEHIKAYDRRFFIKELKDNPQIIEMEDQKTGLKIQVKKIENKAISDLTDEELKFYGDQFNKLIEEQLDFEKKNF